MMYVMGILGFIFGFIFGQLVLIFFLREKTKDELLNDRSLKYTYGLANWIIAGLMSYAFASIYNLYFS
ncbi:MAG: hypothetical protein CBB87_04255 [Micavibrio sp. TMED27]|nr:hypothetical protein [Micavibrio sp.]OUT91248.1 MAG: hypothetical protein CBB87_04255 [Micavibrio sp. TMED27]|tara:strand:- start:828 stop:1031 length:204 start_codon:yes stop_codon:yes gene_type:complete